MSSRFSTFYRVLWLLPIPMAAIRFYPINKIVGRSMHPTLNPDSNFLREDYALFDRISVQARGAFERGDIVVVTSPTNPRRTLVKRVIGKSGDVVKTLPSYPVPEVRVPEGHVWIEGDDPFHSDDSRSFGAIPAGLVQAKLVCILWPPDRIGPIKTPSASYLASLQRDSPSYRDAVADIERKKRREARIITS